MVTRKGLLYAALVHLTRVADRRATMPVLQHVQLDADGDTLRLEATDIATHVVAKIPCQGRISACLPARALHEFVKPDDAEDRHTAVEILADDDRTVTVAVEAALTTMRSLPVGEFPQRASEKHAPGALRESGTWRGPELGELLTWVALAAGTDETRKHLTGVLFKSDEIVAVDGHRLHVARLAGLTGPPALLPGSAITILARMVSKTGEVTATRTKGIVRFEFSTGNITWIVEVQEMIDVTFPPYQQVIPREAQFTATVDRERLLSSVARTMKGASRSSSVSTRWNGALVLERNGDDGRASCTVPLAETTHAGPDTVIGCNARYLAEAISTGDAIVVARLGGPLDPMRWDVAKDRLAVVMPTRL